MRSEEGDAREVQRQGVPAVLGIIESRDEGRSLMEAGNEALIHEVGRILNNILGTARLKGGWKFSAKGVSVHSSEKGVFVQVPGVDRYQYGSEDLNFGEHRGDIANLDVRGWLDIAKISYEIDEDGRFLTVYLPIELFQSDEAPVEDGVSAVTVSAAPTSRAFDETGADSVEVDAEIRRAIAAVGGKKRGFLDLSEYPRGK